MTGRQEVSDWVTLNKHWQLPDGWIRPTSVPYISTIGDPRALGAWLSFLAPSILPLNL